MTITKKTFCEKDYSTLLKAMDYNYWKSDTKDFRYSKKANAIVAVKYDINGNIELIVEVVDAYTTDGTGIYRKVDMRRYLGSNWGYRYAPIMSLEEFMNSSNQRGDNSIAKVLMFSEETVKINPYEEDVFLGNIVEIEFSEYHGYHQYTMEAPVVYIDGKYFTPITWKDEIEAAREVKWGDNLCLTHPNYEPPKMLVEPKREFIELSGSTTTFTAGLASAGYDTEMIWCPKNAKTLWKRVLVD